MSAWRGAPQGTAPQAYTGTVHNPLGSARGCSWHHLNQPCKAGSVRLSPLHFIAVLGLPGQPGAINTGPLAKVQHPAIVLGFLAAGIGSVKCLRANAVLSLEG